MQRCIIVNVENIFLTDSGTQKQGSEFATRAILLVFLLRSLRWRFVHGRVRLDFLYY